MSYDTAPALSKEQLEKSVARLVLAPRAASPKASPCESGLEGKKGAEAKCDVTDAEAPPPRSRPQSRRSRVS